MIKYKKLTRMEQNIKLLIHICNKEEIKLLNIEMKKHTFLTIRKQLKYIFCYFTSNVL